MYSFVMSNLDEVKEILNTLRVAMSLAFGILIFLVGAIIKRYDNNNVDEVFWIGVSFVAFILASILFIVFKITKKTKEIKEL